MEAHSKTASERQSKVPGEGSEDEAESQENDVGDQAESDEDIADLPS
jgi:hypothetical protein